jgi:hypothetical protein
MNPGPDKCNTSPTFNAQPIPYVCANTPVYYNFGAREPDGDSLVYSFVCGFNGANTLQYSAPFYSCTNPLGGSTTINSRTGTVSFTPTTLGNFVMVVEVCEYDRKTGALKGCSMRDIQVVVQNCSNRPPDTTGAIENFTGTGKKISNRVVEVCTGNNFSFKARFWDPDANDSLKVTSDISSFLPGATLTTQYFGPRADSIEVTVSWTAVPVPGTYYPFNLLVTDGACPVPALYYSTYEVYIVNSTFAGFDQSICEGVEWADIFPSGGTSFKWRVISGSAFDTISSSGTYNATKTFHSLNDGISVSPQGTTVYEVTSDLSGTCKNVDTIKIRVAKDYNLSTTGPDTICNIDEKLIQSVPSLAGASYTYQWRPATALDATTNQSATISGLNVTTHYKVTVTSDSGCVKEDSVLITVANPFPENIRATVSDTLICLQDTVDFKTNLGSLPAQGCQLAIHPCQGFRNTRTVGNGSVTNATTRYNYTHPNLFTSGWNSNKTQYLYLASDLQAAGMKAGQLTSLGFEMIATGGVSPIFNDFTIKITCTTDSKVDGNNFAAVPHEVFTPKSIIATTGWNMFSFDKAYNWDGTSNLIVEVCWDNGNSASNAHHQMVMRNTSYDAAVTYIQRFTTQPDACPQLSGWSTFYNPFRFVPNIRFESCEGVDPGGFKFQWDPVATGNFTAATNQQNTKAGVNMTTPTTYRVFIEDTLGVCYDTAEVSLKVVSEYDVKPNPMSQLCIADGIQRFFSPTPHDRPNQISKWTGPGIVNDTFGLFDPLQAGPGAHWIVHQVTGDACENTDSTQFTVVGLPDPGFIGGPFCETDANNPGLTPNTPGGVFKGIGINDTLTGEFDGTNPAYDARWNVPDTAYITYTVEVGCKHDTTIGIPVMPVFDTSLVNCFWPEYCFNSTPDSLFEYVRHLSSSCVSGTAPGSVSWSNVTAGGDPRAVNSEGVFNPRYAKAGPNLIRLDSSGFCGNSKVFTVNVRSNPNTEIEDAGPYCFLVNEPTDEANSIIEVKGEEREGTWLAPLPSDSTKRWMGFQSVAKFRPMQVVAQHGYGSYPLGLAVIDTLRKAGVEPCTNCDLSITNRLVEARYCIDTGYTEIVFSKPPPAPSVMDYTEHYCEGELLDSIYLDTASTYTGVWYTADVLNRDDYTNSSAEGPSFVSPELVASNDTKLYFRQRDDFGCYSTIDSLEYFVHGYPVIDFTSNPGPENLEVTTPAVYSFTNNTPGSSPVPVVNYKWNGYFFQPGPDNRQPVGYLFGTDSFPGSPNEAFIAKANGDDPANFGDFEFASGQHGYHRIYLWGETQYGCDDSAYIDIYLRPVVEAKFPNVFTPGGEGAKEANNA